ncbi:MAG: Aldo/keto reductase [Cytophagales bacterium]|jgi:diketogulonate reductase-like aldo/keto reductase|nr:aldo/keto reductase [Bacteroidota bacterium]WHZ06347.1 MAG: Aldo/keto reductase [Cytophagales bacterium]
MILVENYTLSNGIAIPKLGLGTWFIDDSNAAQAIQDAVVLGYRHIDTAQAYGNEAGVGKGIRECGVDRNKLFVTTKLAAEIKSYKEAVASIDSSLRKLGLDYIDLMIIHSPKPWVKFLESEPYFEGNREAWRALEEAYQTGKIKTIGVSNFEQTDLDNILNNCAVKPMVNQILAHISNTPKALIQYCQDKQILVEAYSPFGHGELFKNQQVQTIAKKYNVTISQLAIRYCLQLGLLPLPKTANPQHMKTNAEVDFIISEADMNVLENIQPIDSYGEYSKFAVFGKV